MPNDRAPNSRKLHGQASMTFATAAEVTEQIGEALIRSEIGRGRHAVKLIAQAANTNARSAQNWVEKRHAPSVASFINLCRRIPELKAVALRMLECDDAIDPEFERRFGEAAQAWLDYQARRK